VKLATHTRTGQTVAVKILNKARILQQGMKDRVEREIHILQTLGRHPNIAPLYDVIDSPTDTYLVLENLGGGELYDFLAERGQVDEAETRRFFHQLVEGIEYCHSKDVIHRDLKLDNLLLDANNNIKIADFGLSKVALKDNMLRTTCGTPHYCAPEILSRQAYHGPEVDVWSCGVILYALLCGRVPFEDESTPKLFEKIQSGNFEMPQHVSESCQDLLSRILQVDPNKRITIAEIRQHPWFLERDSSPKDDKHYTAGLHEITGDGITDDPLAAYLTSSHKQVAHLDHISEEGSSLSHEACCTFEPILDDEQEQKHRAKDEHNHKRWLVFPFWHTHTKHH